MRTTVQVGVDGIKMAVIENGKLHVQTQELDPISVAGVPYRSERPLTIRRREQVGDRLRSLRRWRGLSQQRLGEPIGLDRRSIGAMENGHSSITVDAVLDLAAILRVPAAWLFSDDWVWPDGGGAEGGEWGDEPPPNRYP
jgi:DNA-binding XRE family transcriptional regulator